MTSELIHESVVYATIEAFTTDATIRRNGGWLLLAFDASNATSIIAVWETTIWIPSG